MRANIATVGNPYSNRFFPIRIGFEREADYSPFFQPEDRLAVFFVFQLMGKRKCLGLWKLLTGKTGFLLIEILQRLQSDHSGSDMRILYLILPSLLWESSSQRYPCSNLSGLFNRFFCAGTKTGHSFFGILPLLG